MVSNGDAQVSYCISDNEGTVKPLPVAVKDTTGAGDAFLAGFIDQLCGMSLQRLHDPQVAQNVVQYACALGGLTTTKSGGISAQPSPTEIKALLNRVADSFQSQA